MNHGFIPLLAQTLCVDRRVEEGAEGYDGCGEGDEERHDSVDGGRVREGLRHRRLLPQQR